MGLRTNPNFASLFIAAVCITNIQGLWQEFEIVKIENGECSLYLTNLRAKRVEKSNYAISGWAVFKVDVTNDYETEVNIFYSSKGNNQFVKLPYKVPRGDSCNIVDGPFVKYGAAKDLAEVSTFPAPVPNESLCANYKAGNYTVREYMVANNIAPKVLQPGYYKYEVRTYKKHTDETAAIVLHVKLY